ncbi:pilus assembly protein PilY [Roseateles sp. DAIF2]|uniref:pilus assembly protein n=1 Tax=Roseateles sp. DAIF2 TaxID=2714952 RepID=UPI0018A2F6A4|nr:PilC/PilY family type IV pilus protein [Roseateles sp. DAIF2]QPF72548.1 pilus assembly protein PilY [Roseateles sp. DAIF2]
MSKIWSLCGVRASAVLGVLALLSTGSWGGAADLADRPLATANSGATVRSNLMFVLDDSGSMNWNYLPDTAPRNDVCFGSVDKNLIFYDPTRTYLAPLNSDGTSMSNASFTAAREDGYNNSGDLVNLGNNNPQTPSIYGAVVGTPAVSSDSYVCGARNSWACALPEDNPSYSESYDGTNTVITEIKVERIDAPGKTCRNNSTNSCSLRTTKTVTTTEGRPGSFLWAKRKSGANPDSCNVADFDVVRASAALTATQKTNYANWFSYYRTRMLAMRAGAGRAFAKIDATRFRVGFSKISEYANGGADSRGFLNIRDYDYEKGNTNDQKVAFFSRLYNTSGTSNTPLRPALARAGRYFANKLSGQSDPVQYSCQRNYTILSTDGYWNQDDASPLNLTGGAGVGNPDAGNSVERPMRDEINAGVGFGDTLADVAMYYYVNDLRTDGLTNCSGSVANQDVCENNVPSDGGRDTNPAQHMTTFTLGLGLSGKLTYDKNYLTQTSGHFFDIKQGTKVWPDPINNSGAERIDDLWHAAVNGRGSYYSASNAADMASSLVDALSKIEAATGSSAAAATSSLTPSAGDDWLFVPLYTTRTWDGTVNAFKLNTATGEVINPTKPIWSAAERIKAQGADARKIYFNKNGARAEFTKDDSSLVSKFQGLCSGTPKLSQCATLSEESKAKVTGANVITFLRGSATHELSATVESDRLFRSRTSPLGDIVNGAPVYVKKPVMPYGDGYAQFASSNATRQAVVYVAANDGMLHAIKVDEGPTGGQELWAYVPSMVMDQMYLLADATYESNHRFFVDAAPVVADVKNAGGDWRTILVGGLGKGGQGYYALDVTNPDNPLVLWEFTAAQDGSTQDLGYSYGNPVITKNKAGKWVVAFTSGYNNSSGKGFLYVLDAITGAKISKIEAKTADTKVFTGDAATPSNLGRLNAWVEDPTRNVASRFYAGDMLGNIWRFDFDDNYGAAGQEATLLGSTGSGQPITTRPVLSEIVEGAYRYPVVTVATGRYLGVSDVGDKTVQSVYTFKDTLGDGSMGVLRSNTAMVKQTMKADRSGLDNPKAVVWKDQLGWYVDLSLTLGERVNVDVEQQLNQLVVASNIPTPTACSPGGSSWLYYLDVGSGKPLLSYSGPALLVGVTLIQTTTGKLVGLPQYADGRTLAKAGADPSNMPPGSVRRTSWRELMN